MQWNDLVPELEVDNYLRSKAFYERVFGFRLCYERLENGFGYFELGGAQLMLLEAPAAHERPPSRGVHFQIYLEAIAPLLARLQEHGVELASAIEEAWYRVERVEHGQREFFVADPDGHLFRFCEFIGERPIAC